MRTKKANKIDKSSGLKKAALDRANKLDGKKQTVVNLSLADRPIDSLTFHECTKRMGLVGQTNGEITACMERIAFLKGQSFVSTLMQATAKSAQAAKSLHDTFASEVAAFMGPWLETHEADLGKLYAEERFTSSGKEKGKFSLFPVQRTIMVHGIPVSVCNVTLFSSSVNLRDLPEELRKAMKAERKEEKVKVIYSRAVKLAIAALMRKGLTEKEALQTIQDEEREQKKAEILAKKKEAEETLRLAKEHNVAVSKQAKAALKQVGIM